LPSARAGPAIIVRIEHSSEVALLGRGDESTRRFAMEFGYHVTLVRDVTAAFSPR
jgi:hypothetical protein